MSTIEHGNDAGLDDFLAKWDLTKPETVEWVRGGMAVIGLTNFGEHPVQSTRLAEVLGRPVSKAEALARNAGRGRAQEGVGPEHLSRRAGPDVGPAEPRPLTTARPRANRTCPLPGAINPQRRKGRPKQR